MLFYCEHSSVHAKDQILDMDKKFAEYLNSASNGVWTYYPYVQTLKQLLVENDWKKIFRILAAAKIPETIIQQAAYNSLLKLHLAGGEDKNSLPRLRVWVQEIINKAE